MKPPRINSQERTPLNRLFLSINHYITTGDHYGEGFAAPEPPTPYRTDEPLPDDVLRVFIPVRLGSDRDLDDLNALQARLAELEPRFGVRLEAGEAANGYGLWSFAIAYGRMDELAAALRERPGPRGWGSPTSIIDQHAWHE